MAASQTPSGLDPRLEGVLTLPEAAAYLRVGEEKLAELADCNGVPARKVAGEWRFLRRGLDSWLVSRGRHPHDVWMYDPHFLMDSPFTEDVLRLLEDRLLRKLQRTSPPPKPGTKEAVLRHIGIISDDADLEEQLKLIRKRRETGG
jgi:excisionase family DNA binding protein